MPTGYTDKIYYGTIDDVKDYAAECARAFGAFMHQHDDGDEELRYPEPPSATSFNREAYYRALDKRAWWNSATEEEKYAEWSKYYQELLRAGIKAKADRRILLTRYESMLDQVLEIDVPPDLAEFKQFMVNQLETSIEFDCGGSDFSDALFTPAEYVEWCEQTDERVNVDVAYYKQKIDDEWKRYQERIKFINLMKDTYGFTVR